MIVQFAKSQEYANWHIDMPLICLLIGTRAPQDWCHHHFAGAQGDDLPKATVTDVCWSRNFIHVPTHSLIRYLSASCARHCARTVDTEMDMALFSAACCLVGV